MTISRDPKGNPLPTKKVQVPDPKNPGKMIEKDHSLAKQGDEVIRVEVTYDSKVNPKGHEDIIFKTATGAAELHKSTKVSGVGNLSPLGYIHSSSNTCFLVTRLDKTKHTIELAKQGKVNSGTHEF